MTERYTPAKVKVGDIITNPRTYENFGVMGANWTDANRVCCGVCFGDRIEVREMDDEGCPCCGSDVSVPDVITCLDCKIEGGPLLEIPYMTFAFSIRREFSR